jgi:hypothetical protein
MLFLIVLSLALFIGAVSFVGNTALATEGGGGAYPNGAEDFMSGALPPPGTYFLNYLNYYRATSFKDQNGDDRMPKFDLDVVANVFRLIEVTQYRILGASWAMHLLVPLVYMDADATPGKDNRSGLGDITVDPFILGWHFKNFHMLTGLDIIIPTGDYDKNRLTNTSRNYWTFEPVFALTYLGDSGVEVSGKFMYDFNLKNTDTEYTSGQEFHVDYTLGYHVDKNLTLGVGGYYYHQTTDDEQYGTKVGSDGFRGRVIGMGPQASYNYKNMAFTLKWQKEFDVRNRPQGDNFFFKFMYAF